MHVEDFSTLQLHAIAMRGFARGGEYRLKIEDFLCIYFWQGKNYTKILKNQLELKDNN